MMIAALAGTTPAKNNAIKIRVASTARIISTRLASTFGLRRFQSRGTGELGAMEERDERHGDDQPDQCDRPQRQGEFGVGDMREAADHDVLRIAGDRRGRSDIRRHRHGQQVGHGLAPQRERQLQNERGQHQADRIVHQEGGKNAGGRDDRAEQDQRSPGVRHDPGIGDSKEARKPQTGDDDHHAEQQRDGIEVHRLVGILERQGARCDHEAGADQGDAGPVDAQAGNILPIASAR
jgi:hypothetical protein